jgi:hypothetical protein
VANPSNQDVGRDNLAELERYLNSIECVPMRRDGEVNRSAIALATNLNRTWLYQPKPDALIQAAVTRLGKGAPTERPAPVGEQVPGWATQRIKALEEQLAVARAEVHDLRGRLRRYDHLERHMVETGRLAR